MAKQKSDTRMASGTTVGDWKLRRCLGRGGQGEVWEVKSVTAQHSPPRAMKMCFATDETGRERFEKEVRLLKSINHEHVAKVLSDDLSWASVTTRDGPSEASFVVMDLASSTLEDRAREGADLDELLTIFGKVCGAVGHLHSLEDPVLHRDLKPPNVLLIAETGRVVLSDFGIATPASEQGNMTKAEEVVGSISYRAPEVALGGSASIASDVFSLGRILQFILTTTRPLGLDIPDLQSHWNLSDAATGALRSIVEGATAYDASGRLGGALELRDRVPELWRDVRPPTETPEVEAEQPVTARVTPAEIKVLLVDETHRIQLDEAVRRETERVAAALRGPDFDKQNPQPSKETSSVRVEAMEALTFPLADLLTPCVFYGEQAQEQLWLNALERVANAAADETGYDLWNNLSRYPALLLQYTLGVACVAGEKWRLLNRLIVEPRIKTVTGEQPAWQKLHLHEVLRQEHAKALLEGVADRHTPFSDYLAGRVYRGELAALLPDLGRFDDAFNRFEYLRAMVTADLEQSKAPVAWVPFGRFAWIGKRFGTWYPDSVGDEIAARGTAWPPLAGMFGGNASSAEKAHQVVRAFSAQLNFL